MPKIIHRRPKRHYILPDTNCLWHEDKALVINPNFQSFWDEYSQLFDLELILAEVVKGEILFQQTTSNLKTLERINERFDSLSICCDQSYSHRVTDNRIRRDVKKRLDRWIAQTHATTTSTPINEIDWEKLIESAIWRNPPFAEEKDREKGFRDSLILETCRSFCAKNPNSDIAFVTSDRLLREAAESQLSIYPKLTTYQSTGEFSSYLNLTAEQLTEEFIRSIQQRAREKFFLRGDGNCLLKSEDVIQQIREQFGENLSPPIQQNRLGITTVLNPAPQTGSWQSISNEAIWIQNPQFEEITDNSDYHWKSGIKFVELYSSESPTPNMGLVSLGMNSFRKLRILEFSVQWVAKVSTNARFLSMSIESIALDSESFDQPTPQQLENYDIKITEAEYGI